MNKTSLNILAALAACFGVCNAQANLLNNGSFEIGAPSNGCVAGTSALSGWSVVAGNIDIDSARPGCSGGFSIAAADGDFFIDLTGSAMGGAGKISQVIATEIGQSYALGFWFGGNSAWQYYGGMPNDGPIKSMDVVIDGVRLGNFSVDTSGRANNDAAWVYKTLTFEAGLNSTELRFESQNSYGVFGPYLDGVSLEVASPAPIPEPETYVLMLTGFAAVAAAARRRRAR